jgi:hypothetical protein
MKDAGSAEICGALPPCKELNPHLDKTAPRDRCGPWRRRRPTPSATAPPFATCSSTVSCTMCKATNPFAYLGLRGRLRRAPEYRQAHALFVAGSLECTNSPRKSSGQAMHTTNAANCGSTNPEIPQLINPPAHHTPIQGPRGRARHSWPSASRAPAGEGGPRAAPPPPPRSQPASPRLSALPPFVLSDGAALILTRRASRDVPYPACHTFHTHLPSLPVLACPTLLIPAAPPPRMMQTPHKYNSVIR